MGKKSSPLSQPVSQWKFKAQITGSVRVSAEGDIYPKISIPFENKGKLPDWVALAGEIVEITVEMPTLIRVQNPSQNPEKKKREWLR